MKDIVRYNINWQVSKDYFGFTYHKTEKLGISPIYYIIHDPIDRILLRIFNNSNNAINLNFRLPGILDFNLYMISSLLSTFGFERLYWHLNKMHYKDCTMESMYINLCGIINCFYYSGESYEKL